MRTVAELAGKAKVTLGGEKWESRLSGVHFSQQLDRWATLTAAVAATPVELEKMKLSDYPATAEFAWDGRALFRGSLVGVEVRGSSQIVLTYGDDLRLVGKRTADGFGKQQTLQDTLRKVASAVEMRPRFLGDFSEVLPSFPQGGLSQLDLLSSLADKHGFFFVTRSVADEIVFFRPGQQLASASFDAEAQAGSITFQQSGESSYDRIAIRYFDSKSLHTKEAKLGADELYGPIAAFTGSSSFREKLGWKTSKGHFETHVTDRSGFERAQTWLSAHFSKKVMSQERVTVRCHEPVALPGDKLELTKCPVPNVANGAYLVVAIAVEVGSAIPRATLTVMRA